MNKEEQFFNNLLQNYIGPIIIVISFIPIIIGFFRRNKLTKVVKVFWYYRISIAFIDLVFWFFIWSVNRYYSFYAGFLNHFKIENTYFLSILSYMAGTFFIGLFFLKAFNRSTLKVFILIFLLLNIFIYLKVDGYQNHGTINSLLLKFFTIILCLLYLFKISHKNLSKKFLTNPEVLICFGLLLINVVEFLFSFFAKNLDATNFPLYVKLKAVTCVIDILGYALYSTAFLKSNRVSIQ